MTLSTGLIFHVRNQLALFLADDQGFQKSIPSTTEFHKIPHTCRPREKRVTGGLEMAIDKTLEDLKGCERSQAPVLCY